MTPHENGRDYDLYQLGGGLQKLTITNPAMAEALIKIAANRTAFLDSVGNGLFSCAETKDAYTHLETACNLLSGDINFESVAPIQIIDPGHIYMVHTRNYLSQKVTFIKRSSPGIRYKEEWGGIQTQELLRTLIHYYQNSYEEVSSLEIVELLRDVIFAYEIRAWRRKREDANRTDRTHDQSVRAHAWRHHPFEDVPFNSDEIELRPIGPDGHILLDEPK